MVDPTEPKRDRSDDDSRLPEVVDAEIVDSDATDAGGTQAGIAGETPALSTTPADDEEFRQYQQFLEFQKFREWQRQHGTEETPTGNQPPSTTGKPWWKGIWKWALWLLGFKLIRRLIYLLVFLLVLLTAIDSYFGGSDESEYRPGQPPPPAPQPILQSAPQEAVIAVYDWVATKPGSVCSLFSSDARSAFSSTHGASDCASAVRKLNQQVTEPMVYKNPTFTENAVETLRNDAVVRSCRITVEGGPKLGDFGLRRQGDGGWLIDSYQPPRPCTP